MKMSSQMNIKTSMLQPFNVTSLKYCGHCLLENIRFRDDQL
jgi:hypothetical protein